MSAPDIYGSRSDVNSAPDLRPTCLECGRLLDENELCKRCDAAGFLAEQAYRLADAMLAARERREEGERE